MKRSGALRRGSPPKRHTPLKPRSRKRQALMVERRALVEKILRERPRCEVRNSPYTTLTFDCVYPSEHLHEKLTRARGGSILDESNVLAVCAGHHRTIHDKPEWAAHLGLLVHSWDAEA